LHSFSKSDSDSRRYAGIEGLRGICIASVLVYHYWPRQLPAGFLGVSVFFTISGFVITSGLIRISDTPNSNFRISDFFARRVRRLLPAATVVLTATLLYSFVFGWASRTMANDGLAGFLQFYNWRVIAIGTVYGEGMPSIFGHFWSLSIEAQFYFLVPIIFLISHRKKSIQISFFVIILIIAIIFSATSSSLTFIYSSSVTRVGEICTGCLLAFFIPTLKKLASRNSIQFTLSTSSVLSLIILLLLTLRTSMQTPAYAHGGLLLVSLLSVLLIAGAVCSDFATRLFAVRPLVWLGEISYSLYLVHFPIRIILIWSGIWPSMQTWVSVALSIAISVLINIYIEKPFREKRYSKNVVLICATAMLLAFSAIQIMIRVAPPRGEMSFQASQNELSTITRANENRPTGVIPKVAIYGDSTAVAMSLGFPQQNSQFKFVGGYAKLGCPIGPGGLRRGFAATGDDQTQPAWPVESECDWENWVSTTKSIGPIDYGLVLLGNWDIVGRQIEALGPDWRTIQDSDYQSWLQTEMEAAIDALHTAGVKRVLWLTLPANSGQRPSARLDIFNRLIRNTASSRPWITVVDYATYIQRHDELRPDGIHLSRETAPQFVSNWLSDQIEIVSKN
jgi:peptidoglycan/LPS O-acetylase OafA/YrhL